MRTEYLYLGDDVFSKVVILVSLENPYYLQRESILLGKSPSQLINDFVEQQREKAK